MIVSASYKTDIPAFYGEWFANRLKAGYAKVVNPYGGKPFTVSLKTEDVDGFVFWTRNAEPFMPVLRKLHKQNRPFVVQYTALGYAPALDRSVREALWATVDMKHLADEFGTKAVVWRYDPVVFSSLTPAAWHLAHFSQMAEAMEGVVDEVVVSFAQIYRKTQRNLDKAATNHGFTWEDPDFQTKLDLLRQMAKIARACGMELTICAQSEFIELGAPEARCIDPARLSAVAGYEITAPTQPHRDKCRCAKSRDIGAYDSCLGGCAYCYAVRNREIAQENHGRHDPEGEFLIPPLTHSPT